MLWDGKSVLILWRYQPKTQIAIKWNKLSSGNYAGSDRTADEDIYRANVIFSGPESELIDLQTVLDDNRKSFPITTDEGNEIFGADIDHTGTITVIVEDYGEIRKNTFKEFEMQLLLRHANPTFKTVTPDFTKLRTATHADVRETLFEMEKMFSYDNTAYIADHISNDGIEAGLYTAQFTQTKNEMPAIRRYLSVTARANIIPFPTFGGVTQPFGPRGGSLPMNCRIIKWADLGRQNFCDWNLSITFAREMGYWNQ